MELVLLNGGNRLICRKTEFSFQLVFVIEDYKIEFTRDEFIGFFNGRITITTPKGEVFSYGEFNQDMKPHIQEVYKFLS